MTDRVLVMSMACNGYQWRYRTLISSHRAYTLRHGYDYLLFDRPALTRMGPECAWLKVPLLLSALQTGYDAVVWLDADTLVRHHCPALSELPHSDKTVFAARGYSMRLNSGVMILKQSVTAMAFLKHALFRATRPLPKEIDIGWGENGHLIDAAHQFDCVHYLDQRWNNNEDPLLDDYIRHYSAGPLSEEFVPPLGHRCMSALGGIAGHLTRLSNKLATQAPQPPNNGAFYKRLAHLTRIALHHHPLPLR